MTLYVLAYLVIAVVVANVTYIECDDDLLTAGVLGLFWLPLLVIGGGLFAACYILTAPARLYLRRKR